MARKKHLKRLNAPSSWMLDKLSGKWAPRPSTGPHKLRECLPLTIVLRNRLKYALATREVQSILMNRMVKIDGKARTDTTFPVGFNDVISIAKTQENFRVLYDVKGRFYIHRISTEEAAYKLAKVRKLQTGKKGIPFIVTHDGRTIRYPDPLIRVGDMVKIDLATGKVVDFVKFDVGNLVMVTHGRNCGRIGVVFHKEKHPGSFDIVHVRDARNHEFATRTENVFILGKGNNSWISLPRQKGIKLNILEEQERRDKA